MIDGSKRGLMQVKNVRNFLDSVLDEDIHTKRIASLANATLGVMTGASLGVAVIGKSLAQARGLLPKHAVKQVDRLLSNPRIEAWDVFATWVPELVGSRTDLVVAMDWTDFDADGQATLALKLVTRHGRATPLIWLSVHKDELKDARNDYEDACLPRLAEVLPGRRPGHHPGRPRLRRHQAVRLPRRVGLRLRDPAQRQHPGWRGRRDGAPGGGLDRPEWPGAQAARCHGHRGALPGRRGRVRARQEHEGALVPGDRKPRRDRAADHQALLEKVDGGAQLPGYQGPALRHGPRRGPHRRPPAARSAAAAQCLCRRPAHLARCRWREPRHGPPSQVQHRQDPFSFPVPPRLHALRPDPQHARAQAQTPHRTIRRAATTITSVQRYLCSRVK